MKTRSEWTFDDWAKYHPQTIHHHVELANYNGFLVALLGYTFKAEKEAKTLDEACRLCVEDFCKQIGEPLPWRPDYDLSTVEGCKEAIKVNGYDEPKTEMCMRIWLCAKGREIEMINEPVLPNLRIWQEAAQFAIDNPA